MILRGKKQEDVLSNRLVPVIALQDVRVVPTHLNVLAIMLFLSKFAVGRAYISVRGASSVAEDDDDEQQRDP